MQIGVVGELLLGEIELLAAGFDGKTESGLEGRGGGHRPSLSGAELPVNDIAVDITVDIPLRFQSYDIGVEQSLKADTSDGPSPSSCPLGRCWNQAKEQRPGSRSGQPHKHRAS